MKQELKQEYHFNMVKGLPVATTRDAATYRLQFYPVERHKIRMRLNGAPVSDEILWCNWERLGRDVFLRDISNYIEEIERWGFTPLCTCGKEMNLKFTENYDVSRFKGGWERSDGSWDCPSLSPGKHEIAEDCIYSIVSVAGAMNPAIYFLEV